MDGEEVSSSLKRAVKDLTGEEIELQVDIPQDLSHGDFSTNAAMLAFAKIKNQKSNIKNSMEMAEEIVRLLNTKYKIPASPASPNRGERQGGPNTFRLIEVKSPGFINFWLSEKQIDVQINSLIQSSSSEMQEKKKGRQPSLAPSVTKVMDGKKAPKGKIIFEFGDLNPFKEPHIGHLRNLTLGESIARLLESEGYSVIRANYQGDVGLHVAKCLFGIMKHEAGIKKLDSGSLEEKAKFLSEAYVLGAEKFETDEKAKEEIISINNKLYESITSNQVSNDWDLREIWEKGRKVSLDYFETLYEKLGIKYDKYYFESETAPEGLKIVLENTPKVFERNDGALIYRGEKDGLHTRVFITSNGNPTYESKDLALAVLKNKDYPEIDKSIIMTANEQIDYFKVLLAALKRVDKEIADKTSHLSFGFVNLNRPPAQRIFSEPEGSPNRRSGSVEKMSSRIGNIVSAFWLLEESAKRLKKEFKTSEKSLLDQISTAAVKWSLLKFSRESNISFSIDESIDLAGNSGPYIQYTYARTQSILAKANLEGFEAKPVKNPEEEELALARQLCQQKIVRNTASNNFSPNILCNYLFQLSQQFNKFYEKEKVIGSPREQVRLRLVMATGQVIKEGLYLLGIESPERI